jgi:hypothetical protein
MKCNSILRLPAGTESLKSPTSLRLAERCANRFPPVVNVKSLSREGGSDVWRSLQECDMRLQLVKAAAPLSSEE